MTASEIIERSRRFERLVSAIEQWPDANDEETRPDAKVCEADASGQAGTKPTVTADSR